ncbi:MAG: tripartite tricarboxylate transporter substrate binding protein [Betaproteobacteria bacterium]|nr:tripartite tricarboxylate transporter substrate binding protein [Betaproteobacteria bacterium]
MRDRLVSRALFFVVAGVLMAWCAQAAPPAPTQAPAAPAAAAASAKDALIVVAQAKTPAKKMEFPEKGKAISLVVAYAPGGGSDITGRLVASMLEKELGVPVQVVNKPGGGGQVGTTQVVLAKPDGYTIGSVNLPTVITTYFDPERKAVFTRKNFQLLARQDNEPGIVAVRADSPYKTFKDLVEAAKASPEKIRVGTAGIMSDDHIAAITIEQLTGARFAIVHFDGAAPGRTALLGGHIEVLNCNEGDVTSQLKSGDVRVLGIMDNARSKFNPGFPTLAEQGYKVYSGISRHYVMPAGGPPEVVEVLSGAFKKIMTSSEFRSRMTTLNLAVVFMDPSQNGAFWDESETAIKPIVERVLREAKKK